MAKDGVSMKKAFCLLFLLLGFVISAGCACAEASVQYTGQVHPDLPVLTLTVTDTGVRTQEPAGNNLLQVAIEAQDGRLSQRLTWESIENPAFERMAPLARFMDLNFDGYNDLVLLVAQGARNEFCAFSMWDVEAKRFRPVYQDCEWLREEARFSDETGGAVQSGTVSGKRHAAFRRAGWLSFFQTGFLHVGRLLSFDTQVHL